MPVTDDQGTRDDPVADEQPEDIEVSDAEAEDVAGGKPPSPPGGPVPVPYPN